MSGSDSNIRQVRRNNRPTRLFPPSHFLPALDMQYTSRERAIHHVPAKRYFGNGSCTRVPEGVALLSQSLMRQRGPVTVFKRNQNRGAPHVCLHRCIFKYACTHTHALTDKPTEKCFDRIQQARQHISGHQIIQLVIAILFGPVQLNLYFKNRVLCCLSSLKPSRCIPIDNNRLSVTTPTLLFVVRMSAKKEKKGIKPSLRPMEMSRVN